MRIVVYYSKFYNIKYLEATFQNEIAFDELLLSLRQHLSDIFALNQS